MPSGAQDAGALAPATSRIHDAGGAEPDPLAVEVHWPDVNEGMTFTDKTQSAPGTSLLDYYSQKHAQTANRAGWNERITAGLIRINGVVTRDPDASVPGNSVLEYQRPAWSEPPAPSRLRVLWLDSQVVAVAKPSGLQVLPGGPFHQRCALALLRRLHDLRGASLAGPPAPVHRLGRGTSGVLLCGCTEGARRALSRSLEQHGGSEAGGVRKVYRALVQGGVLQDRGEITVPIGRRPWPGVRGGLYAADPEGGRPARSAYRVLERRGGAAGECAAEGAPQCCAAPGGAASTSLLEVEIFSGRPHQIRIHCAALGHPLLGDPLYGPGGLPRGAPGAQRRGGPAAGRAAAGGSAPLPGDCGAYLLHCCRMEFAHPASGRRLAVACRPPPELRCPGDEPAAWRCTES